MKIDSIPLSIRPYLIEIAERLWTGHASVMVGAGYSKNSINLTDAQKGLPNWHELGDIFYEKIHGEPPGSKSKYINPLKLADEVQAAFGRSVLDQILKLHIPDKDFEPSDAHTKLLELPWSDVFTTNYDTLLERSCENVISRRYDIVINQNDIIYSNRPRIIKLHGSFPSERPLIITEEDYRVYPKKFAPFVNTVQQSLLENTLCLVGFSGDDPNFLQWIGWINDNIGKDNSPKIYLVGILHLSEAQKRLLATKNIVAVDLSSIPDAEGDHKKAIIFFLDFLLGERKTRENLDWAMDRDYIFEEKTDIPKVIEKWKARRLAYPNWIICPQENREALWDVTSQFISDRKVWDHLSYPYDLEFTYELNWRLEKCLFPIYNDQIIHLETVLSRYNPFPTNVLASAAKYQLSDISLDLNLNQVRQNWLQLTLATLRFYREEGFNEKWVFTAAILKSVKSYLTPEQNASFYYEQVLMAIFDSDTELAIKILRDWPTNENDPFWDAKRSMLLADFGFLEESNSILETCLTTVRKRLNLSPVGIDYKWVSQEAYIMVLIRLVHSNLGLSNNYGSNGDEGSEGNLKEFSERWNTLMQFKCSPWQEKKHFDIHLQHAYLPRLDKSKVDKFQIGMSSTTYHLGGQDGQLIIAYNFLRFIEEIGIPLGLDMVNIDNKTIRGTIERIYPASPAWAYGIFNRSRDSDLTTIIFSRKSLSKLSTDTIDRMVFKYIHKYNVLLPELFINTVARNFLKKVPIVLSRLCVKCSNEARTEIFKFYIQVFKPETHLKGLDELWTMLVGSSDDETKTLMIPELLHIPVLDRTSGIAQTNLTEPFEGFDVKLTSSLNISSPVIKDLLIKSRSFNILRYRALTRLMFLYRKNLLDTKAIKSLFLAVWERTDDNGFPLDTPYYNFSFIKWPHPKEMDVSKLYKTYILKNTFNIQGDKKEIGISRGGDRYAEELWYGSANINNIDKVIWTTTELAIIIEKCNTWWNSDKHYLIDPKHKVDHFAGSIYEEFFSRLKVLVEIISRVFGYQKSALDSQTLNDLITLIGDMEKSGLPVLKVKVAFADALKYRDIDLISELEANIILGDKHKIVDSLTAAAIGLSYMQDNISLASLQKILDLIVQPLKWRKVELMAECLSITENIIKHKPDCYIHIQTVILATLAHVATFTDTSNGDLTASLNIPEALLIRQKTMKMANTIYRNNPVNPAPEVMIWMKIAEDNIEFADITNRWNTNVPINEDD